MHNLGTSDWRWWCWWVARGTLGSPVTPPNCDTRHTFCDPSDDGACCRGNTGNQRLTGYQNEEEAGGVDWEQRQVTCNLLVLQGMHTSTSENRYKLFIYFVIANSFQTLQKKNNNHPKKACSAEAL